MSVFAYWASMLLWPVGVLLLVGAVHLATRGADSRREAGAEANGPARTRPAE